MFDSCYDATDGAPANCGSGFAAVFSTDAATGAIDGILVTNAGSGYVGATTVAPNVLKDTCINFDLATAPSGYITEVRPPLARPMCACACCSVHAAACTLVCVLCRPGRALRGRR